MEDAVVAVKNAEGKERLIENLARLASPLL